MRFRVLDAGRPDDLRAWTALWEAWPHREVMAHPEYARLFLRAGDRAVCAVAEHGGGTVLFPLVLRPLAREAWARPGEDRWDAVSPYGYGGPFAWGDGPPDDAAYWRAFLAWCGDERIVSTFARLSLFPAELAGGMPGAVEVRAPNVVVPLEGGPEAIWRRYAGKVRRWVEVARAAGLEVEVDLAGARMASFVEVYRHTMERRGAAEFYLFPPAFFEAISTRLAGHFALFQTLDRGRVVSADLVLCSARHVTYFLGGTLAEAFPLGPNYLLKHAVATWAAGQGKASYVLGGGYEPGDGLHRYKRAYAPRGEVPFRVACLVHDERACRELADDRRAHAERSGVAWAPRAGFFPAYRG